MRPKVIALNTPIQAPLSDFVVHSSAQQEPVAGIATQRARLCESEVLPTNQGVNPRLKAAGVFQGNVRPSPNEKRIRNLARIAPLITESCDSRAFHTNRISEISCDVPTVREIVKSLSQNVEMQILKPRSDLPGLAISGDERRRSRGFTFGTAGIKRRCRILC